MDHQLQQLLHFGLEAERLPGGIGTHRGCSMGIAPVAVAHEA
jgi:hypothetical protein